MIETKVLVGWMLSVVLTLAPTRLASITKEDPQERADRLASISNDIVDIVFDGEEQPLFSGPRGREKSAVLVATFASHESGFFSRGVDLGTSRGDGGSSWCIMQLHIGKGRTAEGWTGPDLIADRKKCVRSGYHIMRSAIKMCGGPEEDRMAAYISGRCDVAVAQSQDRYRHAMKLLRGHGLASYQKAAYNSLGLTTMVD